MEILARGSNDLVGSPPHPQRIELGVAGVESKGWFGGDPSEVIIRSSDVAVEATRNLIPYPSHLITSVLMFMVGPEAPAAASLPRMQRVLRTVSSSICDDEWMQRQRRRLPSVQ